MYMTRPDPASDRLRNQVMSGTRLTLPEEVVAWLGAVQAQDYTGGLWSIGLRLPGTTSRDIENAIARRTIVLSWVLRGTLHLVAAQDIHGMRALLAPGIIAERAARYRQLGLDEKTFDAGNRALEDELRGGRQRTRKDLFAVLESAGISTDSQRGYHLLGRAGLDGVICFGPRSDRQQMFVLLDEWIPPIPGYGPAYGTGRPCPALHHQPWTGNTAGFSLVVGPVSSRCTCRSCHCRPGPSPGTVRRADLLESGNGPTGASGCSHRVPAACL